MLRNLMFQEDFERCGAIRELLASSQSVAPSPVPNVFHTPG